MAQRLAKQQFAVIVLVSAFGLAIISREIGSALALEPLVETGVSALSPEGKHVGVNVPPFFNMKLDTRGPFKGCRMSQSVMAGLVRIHLDRERAPDGGFRGPIEVKVGGITMYNNQEPPLSSSSSSEESSAEDGSSQRNNRQARNRRRSQPRPEETLDGDE